jgi:Ni/Co efflux regulator RcnB
MKEGGKPMKRTVTIIAAAAFATCAFAPAAMAANESPNPKQVANQFCHDQKKAMDDKQSFKELYNGGKRAMQTCKRENRGEAETIIDNAAQFCETYREEDPAGFTADYGDNKNAFGKCVSDNAKEQADVEAQDIANAAHDCKAYRRDDSAGFTAEYGDNKNAFGKCVSDKAREDEEPAPTV